MEFKKPILFAETIGMQSILIVLLYNIYKKVTRLELYYESLMLFSSGMCAHNESLLISN